MSLDEFLQHVRTSAAPDAAWRPALAALWHAERGEWDQAHRLSQTGDPAEGDWVHAHLHREEGDLGNARYWYARCGKTPPALSISEERHALIRTFLTRLEPSP